MLDQSGQRNATVKPAARALDFQQHLAALEAAGLVTRIDRPIDKDTELHTLVRWQFVGGLPEEKRRAFLFTNVVDGSGRRYDMPVVVGALSASPEIYAIGMGKPVEQIGSAWIDAIAHPIAPVRVDLRAMPGGRHQGRRAAQARWRAEAPAGADLDARLRRRALFHRDALRHQGS